MTWPASTPSGLHTLVRYCRWFRPSPPLDTHLTRQEFTTIVKSLGVDVADGNHPCGFCAMPVDSKGCRALSCMAGGDTIATHHAVRDSQPPRRAGCPRGGDDQRTSFSASLASSSSASLMAPGNIAPDPLLWMSLSSTLGERHWRATAGAAGAAAAAYADLKRSHLDTFRKCHEAGIHFQPVVLEAQGGFNKDAAAIVYGIALEAAAVLRRDHAFVKQEIVNKLAVVLCRAAARSINRR